ncbi:MAG: tetratricopeptide repeat protein [Candidatus Omnitrophota bacterium]|jgi:Tfp pilus assembly protein PilF
MKFVRLSSLCLAAVLAIGTKLYALEEQKTGAISHYIMGVYYEDLGDIDKALNEYRQASASDSSAAIHLGLASTYVKKGDLAQAINELKTCIELDPGAVEPHAILAVIYASLNKNSLAEAEYEAALKIASSSEPGNPLIYKELGFLYLKQDKLKEALAAFKFSLTLSPDDFQTHFYLGVIYDKIKDFALSEKELKKAIESNPDFAVGLNYLGYMYAQQNRNLREAEKLIRRALKLEEHNAAYIDSLGWVYFKQGKIKEAFKEIEKASILIEDPEVYDHLGDVYLKLNNAKEAEASWKKSLELAPQQGPVKEKLDKLNKLK